MGEDVINRYVDKMRHDRFCLRHLESALGGLGVTRLAADNYIPSYNKNQTSKSTYFKEPMFFK